MYPFSSNSLDSFLVAETAAGVALGAILWHKPTSSRVSTALFFFAIALTVVAPFTEFRAVFHATTPAKYIDLLKLGAAIATLAVAFSRPRIVVLAAVAGEYAMWRISDWVRDADWELAALHLAWIAALLGLLRMASTFHDKTPPVSTSHTRLYARDDFLIFTLATVAAVLCAIFILERQISSGDEWANTFQADLFAHLKAYGPVPPCSRAEQVFWVFFYQGRSFAQYTPGWPLFLAFFQRIGIAWIADPVMLGIAAVALARLARRAVRDGVAGESHLHTRTVRIAGWIAATIAVLGPSMLLNGASRYPHTMVCACFAWAAESVCVLLDRTIERNAREKFVWGIALGTATSLLIAARPGDGGSIGPAIFLAFVYAMIRRRAGWKPFAGVAIGFTFWGGLTLIILRLQLGEWFKTGYQITELFHPWAKLTMAAAQPNEVKHSLPLGTGSYMWWPCAPAIGVFGLLLTRRSARAISFMLAVGGLGLCTFMSFTAFGHQATSAYGPRFELPLVVPMSVGGAIALAPLLDAALRRVSGRRALSAGGPAAVAFVAMLLGLVWIAPFVYPWFQSDVHKKSAPFRAIAAAHLHNAVVTAKDGELSFVAMDVVQNFQTDPNPDVIIIHDEALPSLTCARETYKNRTWYHARGIDEATLIPW